MEIAMAVAESGVQVAVLDASGSAGPAEPLTWDEAATRVRELETHRPRWIWASTRSICGHLLPRGAAAERCRDLRLTHAVLAGSPYATFAAADAWHPLVAAQDEGEPTLLEGGAEPPDLAALVAEYRRQERAVADSAEPGRLRLLLAAESAGALVAGELKHFGLPWDTRVHDQQLTELLGPKPAFGGRPAKLEALVAEIRAALDAPGLNPDSQPELLRALHSRGHIVATTRHGELEKIDDPVVGPLLEYKKLARLLAANGWAWMSAWVRDGRFIRTTSPAAWSPGDGRPPAAVPCSFPSRSGERFVPTPAGDSWWPTPPSSNRASSPRWPPTRPWPGPLDEATSTRRWSMTVS